MSSGIPRPAREAPAEELLERTHRLRQELIRRGEFLPATWTEEAARDLRSGELLGFWLSSEGGAPGLAVYSPRNGHAFAHVHIDPGTEPVGRALELLHAVLLALPEGTRRADVGLSGLDRADETRLAEEAVRHFGGEVLERHALALRLDGALSVPAAEPPSEGHRVPIHSVDLDRLAELEWEAFRGSPDERLVADSLPEERQSLGELVEGRLGRLLPDCSAVWLAPDGSPVGMILVAEQAPHRSMVLDLVVAPDWRRRGVARHLLESAFERLRSTGGESVRLWVTEGNRPARALYDRLGFQRTHSAEVYRWDGGRGAPAEGPTVGAIGPGSTGRGEGKTGADEPLTGSEVPGSAPSS